MTEHRSRHRRDLDPWTKDIDRLSRGTPLSLRLERLSRFDENNGDRESP